MLLTGKFWLGLSWLAPIPVGFSSQDSKHGDTITMRSRPFDDWSSRCDTQIPEYDRQTESMYMHIYASRTYRLSGHCCQ